MPLGFPFAPIDDGGLVFLANTLVRSPIGLGVEDPPGLRVSLEMGAVVLELAASPHGSPSKAPSSVLGHDRVLLRWARDVGRVGRPKSRSTL